MSQAPTPAPPRLRHAGGETARLLDAADGQFNEGLSESAAWHRLQERRERQGRRTLLGAAVFASAIAGSLAFGAFLASRADHRPTVTAEGEVRQDRPLPAQVEPPINPEQPAPASAVPPLRSHANAALRPVQPRSACEALEQSGRTADALSCYEQVGSANGAGAEDALYAAARLSSNDPQRSLALLETEHRRFPDGIWRYDAELLRAQALARVGRADEALSVTDDLLRSSAAPLVLGKIHLLRATIYQDVLHDCARAQSDFVFLRTAPGPEGDQGSLRRASCLETLGRRDEARAAFEEYVARPSPSAADKARARAELDVLRKTGGAP